MEFHINWHSIVPLQYTVYMLFESFITSKGIVDYILKNNPSLKNDYEVVHSLRECI